MQFYQLTGAGFVTSRKKMQSILICSLDCDANSIFVWVGIGCGLFPSSCPLPKGERVFKFPLPFGERVRVRGSSLSDLTFSRFFRPRPTVRTLMHNRRVLGQRRARIAVLAARFAHLFKRWRRHQAVAA